MAAGAFFSQGLEIDSIEGAHETLTPLLGGLSAGAFLAARILARAAAGEPDKHDEVLGWTR